MRPRRLLAAVASVALLATPSACGSSKTETSTAPIKGITQRDTLRIGTSFDQPGIGLKQGSTYSGFDVDTAKYVASALGVPASGITWVRADPGDRESLLEQGKVDLVFSSYSITAERKKAIDFAGPYFLAHQDLLVRRNDTDITGPKALDDKTVCSVTDTTSLAYIERTFKGDITLVQKPRFSECVSALADSKVDAVTTDDVILAGFAAQDKYKGKLKVVGNGFTDEYYGVGIKKGDTELVDEVDTALKKYISSGAWKTNLEATVGPSGYDIPDPPKVG